MSRRILILLFGLMLLVLLTGMVFHKTEETKPETTKKDIKVLILAKFEVDGLKGDFPGEAQYYYERYLDGAETYEIPGGSEGSPLYVKDGIALALLGLGKTTSALNTMAILSDSRFDYSDALILSTGCSGSARDYGVMGDVYVITAAVDYDFGHHADIRDMTDQTAITWFYDPDYESGAVYRLNPELMEKTYALVKDLPLETTENTRNYMSAAFDGAEWAVREPRVLRGTTVTGDNFWKGEYDHANALEMIRTYDCTDPFACTEMEDVAVCAAAQRMGLLDQMVILRDSVNMDVYMLGATPESLWSRDPGEMSILTDEDSKEAADIFPTAMYNNFVVGSAIIDAVLDGSF